MENTNHVVELVQELEALKKAQTGKLSEQISQSEVGEMLSGMRDDVRKEVTASLAVLQTERFGDGELTRGDVHHALSVAIASRRVLEDSNETYDQAL
jgi:hypothetical protein